MAGGAEQGALGVTPQMHRSAWGSIGGKAGSHAVNSSKVRRVRSRASRAWMRPLSARRSLILKRGKSENCTENGALGVMLQSTRAPGAELVAKQAVLSLLSKRTACAEQGVLGVGVGKSLEIPAALKKAHEKARPPSPRSGSHQAHSSPARCKYFEKFGMRHQKCQSRVREREA